MKGEPMRTLVLLVVMVVCVYFVAMGLLEWALP